MLLHPHEQVTTFELLLRRFREDHESEAAVRARNSTPSLTQRNDASKAICTVYGRRCKRSQLNQRRRKVQIKAYARGDRPELYCFEHALIYNHRALESNDAVLMLGDICDARHPFCSYDAFAPFTLTRSSLGQQPASRSVLTLA